MTLGGLADSFFEYLLKLWLLSDKRIPKYRRMYDEAARAILAHMTALSVAPSPAYTDVWQWEVDMDC